MSGELGDRRRGEVSAEPPTHVGPRPELVESADDPRVRQYRDVGDRVWLDAHGLFVAEGRSVIELALRSPELVVESLLLSPSAYVALEPALAKLTRAQVLVCSRAVMRKTSGVPFHQGAVALVRRPQRSESVTAILEMACSRMRLVVADEVTDPDNVGGLFRNAFAFGASGVLLSSGCASPYYRKSVRTSVGATLRIPFAHVREWIQALDACRASGITLIALTLDPAALPLAELGTRSELPPKLALCVGNEGRGLSAPVLERCALRIRIPMAAGADSVNVATAAAIALGRIFELDASGVRETDATARSSRVPG